MNQLTLNQAARLLVRFFGFYLLFYGVLNLTEFPAYWLRSGFSQAHSSRSDFSSNVALVVYCTRQAVYFVVGMRLFNQPQVLSDKLVETSAVTSPNIT